MNIEVGQVLSLKMRFNNSGAISKVKHPYLVMSVDEDNNYIEIAQLDRYRRQMDKLSSSKLEDVLRAYNDYHATHLIDEDKQVYMTKEEIQHLN